MAPKPTREARVLPQPRPDTAGRLQLFVILPNSHKVTASFEHERATLRQKLDASTCLDAFDVCRLD